MGVPISPRSIIFLAFKSEGKTIFFSSHILQDMELIVDDIGILIDGRITKEGKLKELVKKSVKHINVVVSGISGEILKKNGYKYSISDDRLRARVGSHDELNLFLSFIEKKRGKCISISQISYSLEDLFLKEIKK